MYYRDTVPVGVGLGRYGLARSVDYVVDQEAACGKAIDGGDADGGGARHSDGLHTGERNGRQFADYLVSTIGDVDGSVVADRDALGVVEAREGSLVTIGRVAREIAAELVRETAVRSEAEDVVVPGDP